MPIFSPKEHQSDACADVVAEFNKSDRANVIMPCGTGKTFVGQLVADALKSQATLLLFPSIALIRQTLQFWKASGAMDGANCLCICSDKGVAGLDEVEITEADLGMSITTTPEDVSAFLSKRSGRVVVFCTYHSTPALGDGLPFGFSFDLGVFDEAHRTASDMDGAFAFALKQENLPIKKRMFMTATPKHQVPGENMFSMCDPSVYGETAYVLPFRKAIEDDLICDYKILVSTVTSAEVAEHLSVSRGGKTKGGAKAKLVAAAIAIQKAMAKTGAKKVFSFHNTIAEANAFASMPEVTQEIGCQTLHVSGAMPMVVREKIIDQFVDADRSVLTNARCLTEGVDVPSVDMVVFVDPKRSTVDIVQAIGRSLRTSPGKQFGYILLPVYVDTTEIEGKCAAVAKSVSESQMRHVWSVLANMAEQEAMVAFGSTNKSKVREARRSLVEFEVLGDDSVVSPLRESIEIYYADKNRSIFDDYFNKLVEQKSHTGVANASHKDDPDLAYWCRHIRYQKTIGELSVENIERLEAIGFEWNGRDPLWNAKLQCFISGEKDYRWQTEQRKLFREKRLDPERKCKLDAAGFDFDPMATKKAEKWAAKAATELASANKEDADFEAEWRNFALSDSYFNGPLFVLAKASGLQASDLRGRLIQMHDGFDPLRCAKIVRHIDYGIVPMTRGNLMTISYLFRVDAAIGRRELHVREMNGLQVARGSEGKFVKLYETVMDTLESRSKRRTFTEISKLLLKTSRAGSIHVPFNGTDPDVWLIAAFCVCSHIARKTMKISDSRAEARCALFAEGNRLSVELGNGNVLSFNTTQ